MHTCTYNGICLLLTEYSSALWLECGKIYAKNPQQKNAVLTLKTYCDSHGWPFSNIKTDIWSTDQALSMDNLKSPIGPC